MNTFSTPRVGLVAVACAAALVVSCSKPDPGPVRHRVTEVESLEPATLGAVARVHELGGVWLASQPKPETLVFAAKQGIKTVINVRPDAEIKDFDEKAVVSGAGMAYVHVPFADADGLTDAVFDTLREQLKNAERPILLHCNSANRVGAVWLAHRVLDGKLTYDDAAAEARTIGLKDDDLDKRARQYINVRR